MDILEELLKLRLPLMGIDPLRGLEVANVPLRENQVEQRAEHHQDAGHRNAAGTSMTLHNSRE
jgi:hypothetical protein